MMHLLFTIHHPYLLQDLIHTTQSVRIVEVGQVDDFALRSVLVGPMRRRTSRSRCQLLSSPLRASHRPVLDRRD